MRTKPASRLRRCIRSHILDDAATHNEAIRCIAISSTGQKKHILAAVLSDTSTASERQQFVILSVKNNVFKIDILVHDVVAFYHASYRCRRVRRIRFPRNRHGRFSPGTIQTDVGFIFAGKMRIARMFAQVIRTVIEEKGTVSR